MKMKLNYYIIWPTIALLIIGCSNNSTDDLASPVVVQKVSYARDIKPIIDNNCVMCHSDPPINNAPMRLTTYEFVADAITTRPLLDRISRPQGAPGMMPNNGIRLPQASIDLIARWKNEGLQP